MIDDPYLDLPLHGLRLIEASAGTGKTFTLATLFTRLVVEERLRMGQILAVTFTDAATQELRGRIRERLELAARLVEAGAASLGEDQETRLTQAILQRHLNSAQDETRTQLQARLRLAAEETDLAAIFTIHGFCARVLRDYALDSGQSLAEVQLVPHPAALYAELAADLWRRYGAEPARAELLMQLWNSPDELAADIPVLASEMPLRPELPAHVLPDPHARLDAASERLLAAMGAHLEAAQQAIAAAFDHKTFNGRKARRESFHKAFRELQAGGECRDWSRGDSFHFDKLAASRLATFCNDGKPPPQSPLFHAIEAWCEADDTRRAWGHQQRTCLLHQLRADLRQQLRERKQQQRLHTYDDLIDHLASALRGNQGEALAARLRTQYRFALVDEFQDTDARQWEIFRRLFVAPGHPAALFLIGDPKQAIYGFRGGDVETYLQARTEAVRAPPLTRNFRSRPLLLRAIQSLYDSAGEAAFAGADIQFEPVLPGGRRVDEDYRLDTQPAPALTLCELHTFDERPLSADAAREAAARACVAHIHHVLSAARDQRAVIDGRAVAPGDIAVLVRRHNEAIRIQQALSAVGIAAVAAGRQSLFASEEAHEVRGLLLALLHPSDEGRLRTALSSVLLGQDAAAIALLQADGERQRHWQQRLHTWRERWERAGIFAVLSSICADHAQRLLALSDGERRLTNYLQLAELLQDASPRAIGAPALVDWLHTRMTAADDNDDTQQLRLESDAHRVQILTLHKSKGLEYPLVYLPFIGIDTRPRTGGRHLQIYEQRQRVLYWKIDPASDGWKQALRAAEQAERAEAARLLYVGLTRARHSLWLAVGALPGLATSALGPLLQDTAGEGITILPFRVEDHAPLSRLPPEQESPPPPPRRARRKIASDWWVHSFTQLARTDFTPAIRHEIPIPGIDPAHHAPADDEPVPPERTEFDPVWNEQTLSDWRLFGRRFGNALHTALEQVDFNVWREWNSPRWSSLSDRNIDQQKKILCEALLLQGYTGDDLKYPRDGSDKTAFSELEEMVGRTLRTRLPEGGTLSDLPADSRRTEMEFHFFMQSVSVDDLLGLLHQYDIVRARSNFGAYHRLEGLMTGKVDLIYVRNGKWYIVDYKTNHLSGYSKDQLALAMHENQYDLQALIYTLALHRWLKFRLRGEYDYARDFGSVRYLFCRGISWSLDESSGIYAHRFSPELVHALDALLSGISQGQGV